MIAEVTWAEHTLDPAALRLHGAGDGSVMAYCGTCREPLPILPRPATLGAVQDRWDTHLRELPR